MIRIVIADDHSIVRSGLQQIIATAVDLKVVGEAVNGAEVIDRVRAADFDLLLLDMTMPGLSGVDLLQRIRIDKPRLPLLVLSMHNDLQIVTRALRAGASGYITKDCNPEILLCAIRKVAAGGRFIDPALVDGLVFNLDDPDRPPHESLSDREFQVLQKLAVGEAAASIAEALCLSVKTVSTHKTRLMRKIGVRNNAELIRYVITHQLVP